MDYNTRKVYLSLNYTVYNSQRLLCFACCALLVVLCLLCFPVRCICVKEKLFTLKEIAVAIKVLQGNCSVLVLVAVIVIDMITLIQISLILKICVQTVVSSGNKLQVAHGFGAHLPLNTIGI